MGTTEVVDVESKLASLGMNHDWDEDGPIGEEVGDDEDESEDEDVNASESDDDDDDTTTDEDQDEDDDPSTYKKRAEAAEAQMRQFQSRHDKQQAEMDVIKQQFQQLYAEFNNQKQHKPNELDGLDDDDIVDVKTVKKLLAESQGMKGISADAVNAPHLQQQQAEAQWVASQPDYAEVIEYVNKNKSQLENENLPQGTTAVYFAVREHMAKSKLMALEKKQSKLLKNRRGVPPTGTAGRGKSPSRGSSNKGSMGSQFEALGRKLGIDLTAR